MAVATNPEWSADMGHGAVYLEVIVTENVVRKRTLPVPSYHPNTLHQTFLGVRETHVVLPEHEQLARTSTMVSMLAC